jgi:hypothetical protein
LYFGNLPVACKSTPIIMHTIIYFHQMLEYL